jgi:hypothetical protein
MNLSVWERIWLFCAVVWLFFFIGALLQAFS